MAAAEGAQRVRLAHRPRFHDTAEVPPATALGIGLCQTVSMIPGVSRAGATIMGGVVLGLDPYARKRSTDGLDREARLALDWMRRNVPRQTLRRWKDEGASIVARRLWDDMTHTDPRWLTRVTTRST